MSSLLSSISKYKTHLGLTVLVILTISGAFTIINSQNKPRVRDDFSIQAGTISANKTQSSISSNISGIENSSVKFVHITDTHVTVDREDSVDRFRNTVEEVNSRNIDFVIITGDLVDWSRDPNWKEFNKIYKKIQPPAFATVGNHDYRKNLPNVVWPVFPVPAWKPENWKGLNYYYEHLTPVPENLSDNFSFEFGPSLGDFSFDYGPAHFVVLDSGHDVMTHGFGVQGSGLSNSQINWLEKDLEDEKNIFIAMHHPVFSNENLKSSNCISSNRKKFLNIVKSRDVVGILGGHIHDNNSFKYEGVNYIHSENPPTFRIIKFDNNKISTSTIGQPYEPKNITISMIRQVWTGFQWTHLSILRKVRGLLGEPLNLLVFGVILLTGLGLTYKFVMLKKKTVN